MRDSNSKLSRSKLSRPKLSRPLLGVLLAALLIRAAVVYWKAKELNVDRDNYLAIGHNLVENFEYSSVTGQPTAHRPPLYPMFVAVCWLLGGTVVLGIAQILLGIATVWLTVLFARSLGLSPVIQFVAAVIVALDPLLVQYTSRAMTETLCVFLMTALLVAISNLRAANRHCSARGWLTDECSEPPASTTGGSLRSTASHPVQKSRPDSSTVAILLTGALFGLVTLCRPGMWAFGFLAGFFWLLRLIQTRDDSTASPSIVPQDTTAMLDVAASRHRSSLLLKQAVVFMVGVFVVVSPWTARNLFVFGRPIVMTTHGGYTLLLGNNSVFYEEVVSQERDSVWSLESLTRWQDSIQQDVQASGVNWNDEVARDRALATEAHRWITKHPVEFIEACVLRLRRFWALRPSTGVSSLGSTTVGMWYAVVFVMAASGALSGRRILDRNPEALLLVLSLTLLHSVYWSNTRMRAPVMPVLAVFAGVSVQSWIRRLRGLPQRESDCDCREN